MIKNYSVIVIKFPRMLQIKFPLLERFKCKKSYVSCLCLCGVGGVRG